MTNHQQKQLQIIQQIDDQVNAKALNFTTVPPVSNFDDDPRICLTSFHVPKPELKQIAKEIITQLKSIEPNFYYYDEDSLHMTIKNVRVISDPPTFDTTDIKKVEQVFSQIIPRHQKFNVYFFRLLLLPNNVSLIGTTDPELDEIIFDIDRELIKVGVPDDKKYTNDKYFFSNMTLARFETSTPTFEKKVQEISESINIQPYEVDTVSLVTGNAVFKKIKVINSWDLI